MFRIHQKEISAFARQNPDNFARVLDFVVFTIRERLLFVPDYMRTLDGARAGDPACGEDIDGLLYGHKRAALEQIESEKESLYWQAESIVYHAETERDAARELIRLFSSIFGIGLAKAGFAAQLIYGVGGCLDTHNLEIYGISPGAVKSSRYKNAKRLSTRTRLIEEYLDLCERFGGAESLWDSWCEYVASRPDETGVKMNRNKPLYDSAFEVSRLHLVAIVETGLEKESYYAGI